MWCLRDGGSTKFPRNEGTIYDGLVATITLGRFSREVNKIVVFPLIFIFFLNFLNPGDLQRRVTGEEILY